MMQDIYHIFVGIVLYYVVGCMTTQWGHMGPMNGALRTKIVINCYSVVYC